MVRLLDYLLMTVFGCFIMQNTSLHFILNLLQIRENKNLQTRQIDTKELNAQNEHIKTLESTIKAYDNRVAELVQTIASMKEENERLRNEKDDIITEKELLKLEKDEVSIVYHCNIHADLVFHYFFQYFNYENLSMNLHFAAESNY